MGPRLREFPLEAGGRFYRCLNFRAKIHLRDPWLYWGWGSFLVLGINSVSFSVSGPFWGAFLGPFYYCTECPKQKGRRFRLIFLTYGALYTYSWPSIWRYIVLRPRKYNISSLTISPRSAGPPPPNARSDESAVCRREKFLPNLYQSTMKVWRMSEMSYSICWKVTIMPLLFF